MNFIFTILSIAYISGIFFLADSPIVSSFSAFNPYSLLHIPLYGILTILLVFSIVPITMLRRINAIDNPNNPNVPRNYASTYLRIHSFTHFLIPGLIALGIAIADEIHQVYIPNRDGSVNDVLLDLLGIILTLFFIFRLLKSKIVNRKVQGRHN
ncbi:MAG: VanZ family protein [Syntrophales bacterium]|nr:VanZ family protein [Syntrophales bacterium]